MLIGFYNYTVFPTYVGFAFGLMGIFFSMRGDVRGALTCLLLAGLFDMFDGRIAKTRQRSGPEKKFGIQIDSLSDFVCFGVLPSVIGFSIGMNRVYHMIILILYSLAALIRLAYFNVMEEERQNQTTEARKAYEGLPVTTVTLIFPFLFIFRSMMTQLSENSFVLLYSICMVWIAVAFLLKFKLKKPGIPGMLIMVAIGITELFLFLYFNYYLPQPR